MSIGNVVPVWNAIATPDIGVIKCYYFMRGYGYITPIDGGIDVLVRAAQLHESGIDYLHGGTFVQFVRVINNYGVIIASGLKVLSPDSTELSEEQTDPYEQLPIYNGCIKWFNPERRFGYVEVEGFACYVFIHESFLLEAGHVPYGRFNGLPVRVRVGPGHKPNLHCVKEIVND